MSGYNCNSILFYCNSYRFIFLSGVMPTSILLHHSVISDSSVTAQCVHRYRQLNCGTETGERATVQQNYERALVKNGFFLLCLQPHTVVPRVLLFDCPIQLQTPTKQDTLLCSAGRVLHCERVCVLDGLVQHRNLFN